RGSARAGRVREPQRTLRGVHHPQRLQQERGAGRGRRRGARRPRHRDGSSPAAPGRFQDSVTPRWSVVIPAFNEAERLPPFLEKVVAYFEGRDEPYEVIVVDDGSTDGTAARVEARRLRSVSVLRRQDNAGKGAAVRAGMLAARGAYRVFIDADGATPIEELKRLEPLLVAGADVVIGSRVLVDPGVAVTTRPHRVAAGRLFNWLVARMGLHGIADSQCGFKAFTAPSATRLFEALSTQ